MAALVVKVASGGVTALPLDDRLIEVKVGRTNCKEWQRDGGYRIIP